MLAIASMLAAFEDRLDMANITQQAVSCQGQWRALLCTRCIISIAHLAPRLGVLHLSSNGLVRPTQA